MFQKVISAVTLAIGIVAGTAFVWAQSQQLADSRVVALLDQAAKQGLALRTDDALLKIDEALVLAERLGDRPGRAMSYREKARALSGVQASREAIEWYLKALGEFESLGIRSGAGQAMLGLCYTYQVVGDVPKAKEMGARALRVFEDLGDERGRAAVLDALFPLQPPAGQPALLDEILAVANRLQDDGLRAAGLRRRAVGQFAAGDLANARTSLEAAIGAYERVGNVEGQASCWLTLGRVLRAHGDYEGAIQRYDKTIDLLTPTRERFAIVEAYNAKGVALAWLKRLPESMKASERGLALAKESGNQRLIDFMEGNFAGGLVGMGRYEEAIALLRDNIARPPEPYLLPFRLASLATALARAGRPLEALEPRNEAVRLTRAQNDIDSLPTRLDNRADLFSQLGRYDEALADSREALDLVEQVRARLIPSDFLKRGYGDRVQASYVRIVNLLSRLGRPIEALEMAEQGRARAFLDLLATRTAADANLETRGSETARPGSSGHLASESTATPLRVAEMSQLARRLRSTILSYWVSDDDVLVWVIRGQGDPVSLRLPISGQKIAALVAATTAPMREPTTGSTTRGDADVTADLTAVPMRGIGLLALSRDDKSSWRDLHKALIEPLRSLLPARGSRLTIVPHGSLFQLSFAALRSPSGRYLIEDYELNYAPSVSMLDFTGRAQQAANPRVGDPWLIIGNPSELPSVAGRRLAPIPGAGREIASISSMAPKGTVVLKGNAANEAALVQELDMRRPSLVHFATHGFVFEDSKTPAFLALNRQSAAASEDGFLTVDEVYGLGLSANLVVLSACRTGSGPVSSDGIVGLTRGFFDAGTPSVMATFWDVTDDATALLMSSFYRSYARDHAKGRSLRSAQLALLADLRAGKVIVTVAGRRITLPEHPLLWAAFFLSGEP